MTKKEMRNQKVSFHFLPDNFVGYYIEIEGFNGNEDRISYYDPTSNEQHSLERQTPPRGAEGGSGSEENNP